MQGLRFYIGTSEVVHRVLQECQDFVYTRSVQRDEIKQVSHADPPLGFLGLVRVGFMDQTQSRMFSRPHGARTASLGV